METLPTTQAELDSLRSRIESYPFYDGLLYNTESQATLMMVFLNNEKFDSEARFPIMDSVMESIHAYSDKYVQLHYSGLPHIRNVVTRKVKGELNMFILLSAAITGLILLIFFRSFKVMIFCMLVCLTAVIFSLGTITLFGYQISMLMALIPPLIIVIGIPNCVYLLNKYQSEFRLHGNKIKALHRVIQKVGNATFMTNTTTALGFATFIFVDSEMLQEFGVIASINIMIVFILSILLVPIIFSFLADPKEKHTKHLEKKWIVTVVDTLISLASNHRRKVYLVTLLVLGFGIYGITLVQTTGNIVDDLPEDDTVLVDLHWFEDNFQGVMPFEILVDTREKGMATGKNAMKKIEKMQKLLLEYPDFSKSLSLVDAFKFTHQSYYKSNNPDKYVLPFRSNDGQILADLVTYITNTGKHAPDGKGITHSFIDSVSQSARVSVQVADIGTIRMDELVADITPRIDSIFNGKRGKYDSILNVANSDSVQAEQRYEMMVDLVKSSRRTQKFMKAAYAKIDPTLGDLFYDDPDTLYALMNTDSVTAFVANVLDDSYYEITLTGTSVAYVEGTNYMVKNLFTSLALAILIIAVIMALLFNSVRMVLVSLLPNLIPLIFTASIMGYFGIAIKPSTILVFSIAFGISIDDTIHFLAKYRQELKSQEWDIKGSVINAIRETGVSMIYTSIILFFGFCMFGASSFGGIVALGVLVSVTLLVAMLANLVLLPSLLLSLEKSITTKAFDKEPLLEILDEEEDIDLEELVVKPNDTPTPINTD
jgi:predicted RND superfamily exporter protein